MFIEQFDRNVRILYFDSVLSQIRHYDNFHGLLLNLIPK